MKYLFSLLMMMAMALPLQAQQGVGIGTAFPNASAILDLSSTTKGLLLPRVTSGQRAIVAGVAGLVVYDVDFKEMYQHDGTAWRKLLNSTFWNSSSTRKWIYNIADSIGLGTSTPDARLDVAGSIKTSGRIDVAGIVEANGIRSTSTLYAAGASTLAGNVVMSGNAFALGDISTNTGININNAGTLQFAGGGVNKGFVQLSGENLRMGTNGGNTTGDMIVRLNGNDLLVFAII